MIPGASERAILMLSHAPSLFLHPLAQAESRCSLQHRGDLLVAQLPPRTLDWPLGARALPPQSARVLLLWFPSRVGPSHYFWWGRRGVSLVLLRFIMLTS